MSEPEVLRKFEPNPNGPNELLEGDCFYISFNVKPHSGIPIFASDGGVQETAICYQGSFFILNGDFRATFEELAPKGIGECLKFFNTNEEHHSTWSSCADPLDFLAARLENMGGGE